MYESYIYSLLVYSKDVVAYLLSAGWVEGRGLDRHAADGADVGRSTGGPSSRDHQGRRAQCRLATQPALWPSGIFQVIISPDFIILSSSEYNSSVTATNLHVFQIQLPFK